MFFRIVVAEDDDAFCYVLQHALTIAGYSVDAYTSTALAWDAVAENATLDLLVTDVLFPPGEPTGLALARNAQFNHPRLPVIYLTGVRDVFDLDQTEPEFFLTKPFEIEALIALVAKALSQRPPTLVEG